MPSFLRILVVDDRLDSVATLVDHLRALRHHVDTTDNSMEALSLVGRKASAGHGYHLLITDLTMPLLDGMGLVRELRRRNERMPVAFITGYHTMASKMRQESTDLGVIGVLGKPTTAEEVTALLAKVKSGASDRLHAAPDHGGTAFFGTARLARTGEAKPEEGVLSRARVDQREQAAPVDLDALLGRPAASAPAASEPIAPEFTAEAPQPQSGRRSRTPDPSAYYSESGTLGTTSAFYKRPKTDPFLPANGRVDPRVAAPPPGTARDPVTGNYRRTPSGLHEADRSSLKTPGGTTSRFRREVGNLPGTPPAPPTSFTPLGQPALPPQTNITSGFRRSLTGTTGANPPTSRLATNPRPPPTAPPAATSATCTVACAHCNGQFQVLLKPTAYTVLCVHCGQLNRIDPL